MDKLREGAILYKILEKNGQNIYLRKHDFIKVINGAINKALKNENIVKVSDEDLMKYDLHVRHNQSEQNFTVREGWQEPSAPLNKT